MPLSSSITTRLEYQHKSLIDLIEGLSDEQVRQHVIPGKWSIFENIVHLATYQHTFMRRTKQMLAETTPSFSVYTAESDPLFHDNCSRSTREIMQDLISSRRELATSILSLKEQDFIRKAIHPVYGSLYLSQWLHFFLLHESHHHLSIFKLGAALRKEDHIHPEN
jgi:uncharacterized damage-inducible protein DinB